MNCKIHLFKNGKPLKTILNANFKLVAGETLFIHGSWGSSEYHWGETKWIIECENSR